MHEYLGFEGGPPNFRQDFTCPALLKDNGAITRTGLSPAMAELSRSFRFTLHCHWPGPRSLATTCGVSVDVLSCGYLDVSVPRVRFLHPIFSGEDTFHDTWKPVQLETTEPPLKGPSSLTRRTALRAGAARARRKSGDGRLPLRSERLRPPFPDMSRIKEVGAKHRKRHRASPVVRRPNRRTGPKGRVIRDDKKTLQLNRFSKTKGGFPHSEIHGSKPIRGSPRLIAAYHVLHRLCMPRHPLNALKTLDRSHCQCSSLAGSGKPPNLTGRTHRSVPTNPPCSLSGRQSQRTRATFYNPGHQQMPSTCSMQNPRNHAERFRACILRPASRVVSGCARSGNADP